MLNLDTTYATPTATLVINELAPRHAEHKDLNHRVLGSDDMLLGIMSRYPGDKGPSSVSELLWDFGLSMTDVREAIIAINERRSEKSTSTGASDGVNKALKAARRNAKRRTRNQPHLKQVVTRWDIFVGLIETNDKTFQLVINHLIQNKVHDHFNDFASLKARVKEGKKTAKAFAMN